MSLINRLERRFGRLAVPNLTMVLLAGQAVLYVLQQVGNRVALENIWLLPDRVLAGEVWRLLTFLFDPPGGPVILAIFYFWLFYMFGTALEHRWGEFRYNIFIFIGYVANVAAAFIAYWAGSPTIPNNVFLYGTIFLAFARFYPDFTLNIFFILPIRIKWLALIMWIGYAYAALSGALQRDWTSVLTAFASVANYLTFFGREHLQEIKHGHRRRSFQTKAKKAATEARHECRVCGLNSNDSPRTLFRYCSKCAGQVCYCPDHIRDHEHVAAAAAAGREM